MSNAVTALAVWAKTDPAHMEALWLAVERLISLWARKYHRDGEARLYDTDDLIQSGYLALCDAVKTFDPARGEFTTHLGYHIKSRFAEAAGRRGNKKRPEHYAVSLDIPLNEEGDITLLDAIPDPGSEFADDVIERTAAEQDCAALLAEIDKLDEQMRQALLLTGWEGLSLREAAEIMGVSIERVRQCRRQAASKVRGTKTGRIIGLDYYYQIRHV